MTDQFKPSAGVPPPAAALEELIADFEAAIQEPKGQQRGTCWTCGVDHDNEQRLNRAVIALTLRRLKKLRLSPPPPAETPRCTEVSMGSQIAESGRCALPLGHGGDHSLSDALAEQHGFDLPMELLVPLIELFGEAIPVPPPADETWQPILSKATDDGNFSVTIHAKIQPGDAIVSGDTLLRLSKLLTEAADGILRNHPLPSAPAKETP